MTTTPVRPMRGPAVRDAIVDAAAALFAEHGIRAVSADRILETAGYSKVTFYRHFPTKDDVVVAYLTREVAAVRAAIAAGPPQPDLEALAATLTDDMCRPHFRGCPFINAAAEYPEPGHPVREVITEFRTIMIDAVEAWLAGHGVPDAHDVAWQVMMLRDGALVAGYLDGDASGVAHALARGIGVLTGLPRDAH